jgi:predicted DNA binding CopG/RHH family protein
MTPWRVKSLKGYEGPFVLDAERILSAMKRYKHAKRKPTSVALDERTIRRLKVVAKEQGIPYQVLMRIFITYGLEAMKKAS